MLGTHLGYHSGCTLEDIQCLTDALDDLHLKHSGKQSQQQPAPVPVTVLVEPQAGACQVTKSIAQCTVPPGQTAMENHKKRMREAISKMFSALEAAEPSKRQALMELQHYAVDRCLKVCQGWAQTEHVVQRNFQKKGDCNANRHKNFLEMSKPRNTAPGAEVATQQNFQCLNKSKTGSKCNNAIKKGFSTAAEELLEQVSVLRKSCQKMASTQRLRSTHLLIYIHHKKGSRCLVVINQLRA